MMGFKVNASIQDISDLHGRITKFKGEYFLGKVPMEDPCNEVKLTLSSHTAGYSLKANVGIVEVVRGGGRLKGGNSFIEKLLLAFKDKYDVKRVKNSLLFMNKEGKYDYIVRLEAGGLTSVDYSTLPIAHMHFPIHDFAERARGDKEKDETRSVTHQLTIAVGEDSQVSLVERKLLNVEDFTFKLREFFEIMEISIDSAYVNYNGGNIPESSLPLRPTKVNNSQRNAGLRGLFGMGGGNDLKKAIEIEKPNVPFTDIGGLLDAKKQIEGVAFAIKNPELYKKWGTTPPKGIIMVGEPGTGKTELARALATKVDCSFYHVKITDLLSVFQAQSEANVAEVFDIAKENSPSIIFLDEVDAIGTSREIAGSETTRQMVSVLLENMNGLEDSDGIIIIAATNHIEAVDKGLLRAGRFNRIIHIPKPDDVARNQIFDIHIGKAKKLAERELFNGLILDPLVKKTNGLTGSDIAEIVRRSLEEKVREEGISGKEPVLVSTQDMLNEIDVYERLKVSLNTIGFNR